MKVVRTLTGQGLAAFLRGLLPEANHQFDDQIADVEQEAVTAYKAALLAAVEDHRRGASLIGKAMVRKLIEETE